MGTVEISLQASRPSIFERMGLALFLAPMTLFMLMVFILPLAGVVYYSLYDGSWSLESYKTFATGKLYHRALYNTLVIGFSCGLVSVVLGYFVAYHLSRMTPRKRSLYMALVMLPFWTSILVKSYAFVIILGTHGVVNKLLQWITGTEIVLPLMFNRIGVIIGMSHWLLPFAIFPILSSLLSQQRALCDAAAIMGARPAYIFWRVTFPLSLPGVVAGGLMASVIGMGSFVTPSLLGGRSDLMMANLVDFFVRQAMDWRMASTISVVLILLAVVILLLLAAFRMKSGLEKMR